MKIKLLMVLLLFASTTFAQDIIKGIVKDDQNKTLPGANIVFKNTSKGTMSDKDGKFEIEVTSFPQSLSISFVGFETREMEVRENTFLDISLSSSISIDEVEVTSKVNSTEFSLISPLQTQKN
jgi:iron complex outermembrane receptor protein